jgi:dTMP kinase
MINLEEKNLIGKFIVFEGIDGSGKSTQANELYNCLIKQGEQAILVQEPGKDAKPYINEAIERKVSMRRATIAFSGNRALNLQCIIEPALAQKKTVICDRYFYSTMAYQGVSIPMEEILELNEKWVEVRIPDIVLFLDLKPNEAIMRIGVRGNSIEYEKLDFLEKVYANYQTLLKLRPEIKVIDGSGSKYQVSTRVLDTLKMAGLNLLREQSSLDKFNL